MLGLLSRSRAPRGSIRRRVVLRLDGLEERAQPSSGPGDVSPPLLVAKDTAPPANQAPVIEDFTCEEIGNGLYLITGRVVDEMPGGLVITLGGSTSAAGLTTTTQSDGSFSMTVQLRVDGTDIGTITAITQDDQGVWSDEVEAFVQPTPP